MIDCLYNTDGVLSTYSLFFNFSVLIEAERDKDFSYNEKDFHTAIAQCIAYLKHFQLAGDNIANVIIEDGVI